LALRAQLPCASQRAAFSGVEALPHPRQHVVEVAPAGGTLVLFDSVAVIHEVRHPSLPTHSLTNSLAHLLAHLLAYLRSGRTCLLGCVVHHRCCPPRRESELRWRAGSTRLSRSSPSGMVMSESAVRVRGDPRARCKVCAPQLRSMCTFLVPQVIHGSH
jgi:hypothetical protein